MSGSYSQQPGLSGVRVTSEVLQCPARLKRTYVTVCQGYSTLSSNIVRFSELPMPIDIGCLDERSGIEATLLKHKAKWYKFCYSKFNSMKLQQAEKRKASMNNIDMKCPIAKYIHTKHHPEHKKHLPFCETSSTSESLHQESMLQVDSRIQKCALALQDIWLLAKLPAQDMVAQDEKYH